MIKIIIYILLLLNINLFAESVDSDILKYKKACKDGSMSTCVKLGGLYFTGDGVEKNHKKAKKLFERACKKGYTKACYYLGGIYKRGADGIEKNIKRAKLFYAHACQIGHMPSCDQYRLIKEKIEIRGLDENIINYGG